MTILTPSPLPRIEYRAGSEGRVFRLFRFGSALAYGFPLSRE